MKKKILAILMATLTVGSLLSGCGGAQSGDAAGKQESGKQESSDSEEPAEVVFAYMTQNNIPESSELERIQNLINDYTVDKINTKVKLVLFSNSDYTVLDSRIHDSGFSSTMPVTVWTPADVWIEN